MLTTTATLYLYKNDYSIKSFNKKKNTQQFFKVPISIFILTLQTDGDSSPKSK